MNENTYDSSSKKRVTKTFLEVSRRSRAKQRQRNAQKKCAARAKLLFCSLDLLLFFTVLRRCLRRLALHDHIFCLNKLYEILSRASLLVLAKSIYYNASVDTQDRKEGMK